MSLWRHLIVGGFVGWEARLRAGVKLLSEHRDGSGKWRRFPFYYTLLALDELKFKPALTEMKYAAPVLERYLKRKHKPDKYNQRRVILAQKILEKL